MPNEAQDLPFGLCSRIMLLRDYVQSRSMIENSDPEELKKHMTPSIERVLRTQIELEISSKEED